MTTLVLVRHGHTAMNNIKGNCFRGLVNIPLDERGLKEAELTASAIQKRFKVDAVYSSSVDRAMVTADKIASRFGLKAAADPGLLDVDYGSWTGLSFADAKANNPQLFEICMHRLSQFTAPGGDSVKDISARAMATARRLAKENDGRTIVIVTHTFIIRLIILGILGLSADNFWRIKQDTCAINVIEYDGESEYSLVCLNDAAHIREAGLAG